MSADIFAFRLLEGTDVTTREQLFTLLSAQDVEIAAFTLVSTVFFAKCERPSAEAVTEHPSVLSMQVSDLDTARMVRCIDTQWDQAELQSTAMGINGVSNAVAKSELIAGRPAYPVLTLVHGKPKWTTDAATALMTRFCYVGAINVSLHQRARGQIKDWNPVDLALTEVSARFPVVIAAGNVDGDPDRTMYGWPLNPATIAVGAINPDGTSLLSCSRVGTREGIPGPDVVANGVDESGKEGTSFAAPVAATQLAVLAAALMAVRAVALAGTEKEEGAPLAGRCFVDWDRALPEVGGHAAQVTDFRTRERALPALPLGAVAAGVRDALGSEGRAALAGRPHPEVFRSALLASARPVPNHHAHEVGNGVVSAETTRAYLADLTVADVGDLYGFVPPGASTTVFDDALLDEFLLAVRQSMLGWSSGIKDFNGVGGFIFVESLARRRDVSRSQIYE